MEEDKNNMDERTSYSKDSADSQPGSGRSGSGLTGKKFTVPEDLIHAGHDTDIPRADSPESLDQDVS